MPQGLGLFVNRFVGRQELPCGPRLIDAAWGELSLDVLKIASRAFEPGREPARRVAPARDRREIIQTPLDRQRSQALEEADRECRAAYSFASQRQADRVLVQGPQPSFSGQAVDIARLRKG